MRTVAIIPARMASSRFPGKPLAPILGLPMIEHVRRRVMMCDFLDEVYVATCDEEIKTRVEDSDGKAIMTQDIYERCLDRVAEAARTLKLSDDDVIIVVQGDEPLVMPEMLKHPLDALLKDSSLRCMNGIARINDEKDFENPNTVKVVISEQGNLIYQSREPVPSRHEAPINSFPKRKQLGIYVFRNDFLQEFSQLNPSLNEEVESSDLNRAVDHGYALRSIEIEGNMWSVDVPDDIARIEGAFKNDSLVGMYLNN